MPDEKNQNVTGTGEVKTSPEKAEPKAKDKVLEGELDTSRENMTDKLDQPGALEVEEMEESNELLKRRNSTKNKLQASVEVDENSVSEGGSIFEESAGLREILKEANLSPKHLRFCCSGILIFLVMILLVFGGIQTLRYFNNKPVKDKTVDPVEEVIDETTEETVEEIDDSNFLDPSILSGILVGESTADLDPTLGAGQELGEELFSDDILAEYIIDLGKMVELMDTNVPNLLDQSRDRQSTFDDYSNELNFLLFLGRTNVTKLAADKELFEERIASTNDEKNALEDRFFEKLKNLDAYGSVGTLDAFVEEAETLAGLRAQYQARLNLIFYYEAFVTDMELRAFDLDLNEEALVKGVQVVDVHGSDLELIIDETQL